MRAPIPLVERGGLNRTCGSLAGFTGLGFLSLGVYLLADAFAHPVDAEAPGLIVASLAIAMAMLLFVFVFKQRRIPEIFRHKEPDRFARRKANSSAGLLVVASRDRLRSDLPYQRTFVDRSRIPARTLPPFRRAEPPGNSSLPQSCGGEFDDPRQ